MLILFDIDGTILLTHGQGMQAMLDAGRDLCGEAFTIEGAQFSGWLDPLIWRQLCDINSITHTDVMHDRFRARYAHHLRRRFDDGAVSQLLPGVRELIDALAADEEVVIGLVTGNYPETGQLKIERAGLRFDVFRVFGWGCDGQSRRDLPRVAIEAHAKLTKSQIELERVIVIGDTPHDIDCAVHNGCRALGVATGAYSQQDLAEAGASMTVANLGDTARLVEWMYCCENGAGA